MPVVGPRLHLLSEFADMTRFFFEGPDSTTLEQFLVKGMTPDKTSELFSELIDRLGELETWQPPELEASLETAREHLGLKKPQIFMPLRLALTGRRDSPPLPEVLTVLGQQESLKRMSRATEKISGASREES